MLDEIPSYEPGRVGPGDVGPGDVGRGDVGPGDLGPGDLGRGDLGRGDVGPGPIPACEAISAREAIWASVEAARRWLDAANGTSTAEISLRILKIVEEAGEAAAAWVGATGQNPRKGVTHTLPEVAAELGDVAFTALVAAASLGFDPQVVLAGVAEKVTTRLPVAPPGEAG